MATKYQTAERKSFLESYLRLSILGYVPLRAIKEIELFKKIKLSKLEAKVVK